MQSKVPDQQMYLTWSSFTVTPIIGIDAPTINHARFINSGKKVDILVNISGTISSTPSELTFNLPFTPAVLGGRKPLACFFTADIGATYETAVCFVTISDSVCHIQRSGGSAFVNGTIEISVSGTYEAA